MIVLDANILIRAILGRRVRQLLETCAGHVLRDLDQDTDFFGTGVAIWTSDRIEISLKEQVKPLEAEES